MHACRSTLEDPTWLGVGVELWAAGEHLIWDTLNYRYGYDYWVLKYLTAASMGSAWPGMVALALLLALVPATLPWMRRGLAGRALTLLGHVSYSLYLTHLLVLGRLTAAAGTRMRNPAIATAVFVAEVSVCLAVAYLFYRVVERPAVRWSHYIQIDPHRASRAPSGDRPAPDTASPATLTAS